MLSVSPIKQHAN